MEIYEIIRNQFVTLKRITNTVVLFLICINCFADTSYTENCQKKINEAKDLIDDRKYTEGIELLKSIKCESYEYHCLLLSACYEIRDLSFIRQYTDNLLNKENDSDSRAVAYHYNALALYQQKILEESLKMIIQSKYAWKNRECAQYAMTCNTYGNILDATKNNEEALNVYNEALEVCKRLPETIDKFKMMIVSLNNIAASYLRQGKKNALSYIKTAVQIYNDHPDETVTEYLGLLNNIGTYYSKQGDYKTAIEYYQKAVEIKREILGENHPSYALSLLNIAITHYSAESYAESLPYISEYIRITRNTLQRNFAVMTEQERERYWNMQSEILDKLLVTATYGSLSTKTSDASQLYDLCLLSKGLLLDTSVQMESVISKSGNPKLKQLRQQLRDAQKNLTLQDERDGRSAKKTMIYCDSLERVLVQELGAFRDYMHQIKITWKDVQSKLEDNDIAVEFLCLGSNEKDREYAVVMLRRSWQSPKVVYINGLAETLASKQITRTAMHDNVIFGKLVWKAVCNELPVGGRIWFVPDGELHLLGIEFLKTEKGKRMCDNYEMHRLSSTKQLVYEKDSFSLESVALLGGMDFNAGIEELNYYADEYNFRYRNDYIAPSIDERIWVSLPGTLKEVQNIDDFLKKNNKQTFCATRDAATAAAFYSLSGKHYDILHIATHGFYNDSFKKFEKVRKRNAMDNSGLVMSGANTLKTNPNRSLGNGIVTAKEISKMDFTSTSFVILSACQTGLGEVSTEGVFGLQRSFKMAGAKCILATLWEVDDAVAKHMMTSLYESLVDNGDIYNAYRYAINSVKQSTFMINNKNVSGDDISLWGAFVLIDR